MSQSTAPTRPQNKRISSVESQGRLSRGSSRQRRKSISFSDAYLYALRVAFLSYLLQPRAKRKRHVTKPSLNRNDTSASFNDLMKDFSLVRDTKSTRFPHDFVKEVEKRLQRILIGKETRPEYQDSVVKRSFAIFLNTLSDPQFKKRMEADRRVEDLVLIFFSNATKELQRGKPPGDDGVKRMVDRHVALFVRLLSTILKEKGWAQDKPELATRLATLEKKLLKHDEDLSSQNGTSTLVEEVVPLTYEVRDMPLVQVVGRVFGMRNTMLQSDIDKYKPQWTEKAALQDLKTYQTHLNTGSRRTLTLEDFDTADAFEAWKKSEAPDLSQMMLAIIQVNPELAKVTAENTLPQFNAQAGESAADKAYSDMSRQLSQDQSSSYVLNLPDLNGLSLMEDKESDSKDADQLYTFIPSDPRSMYRFIMLSVLNYDLNDKTTAEDGSSSSSQIFSKQSAELLNELALRWRIPKFSRIVIFLDIIREKFVAQDLSLDMLDAAFNYVKEPPEEDTKNKRASVGQSAPAYFARNNWTVLDFAQMRKLLADIYHALLRDLYSVVLTAYADKAELQRLGALMTVMDDHLREDPSFSESKDNFELFKKQASAGLESSARDIYQQLLEKQLPTEPEKWEFFHVQELAKAVLKLCEKIQKRFKRNPEILSINPLMLLMSTILPAFAEDSKALVESVLRTAQNNNLDLPIQDGFDLYRELSDFRRVHSDALPQTQFPYKIEDLLADFVWRWINATEQQVIGWVENAVNQDNFKVRVHEPGQVPTEDQRHSVSVIDIFRSFNQVIEQIAALNWDDDLTYAKFMTSVSKALGNGIMRYCELVDAVFTKEMDRLTPEQEAAASMTRQEKWMQMAKDTWNNAARVEPFNFYPESFVKLNNISFAISHWDKLEQEINVDACADVIKQYNPPTINKPRKTSNYVFTIKIVEAEDLKACDVSGFSDPYVVLADEYQKRLSKTRIIYRNLNPRWDESLDISTQGPLNLIATIWDWDAVGDHDYVGRTTLKLDPAHFSDFLPREYWLDLDTQGRLLVRVSMEGERDDIQFYFGKAFRTLQRTQRDMTRKITDKLSSYIQESLSKRALRALLNKGISVQSVSAYFQRKAVAPAASTMPTEAEIVNALRPLFNYFDDNFAIMNQTLTSEAMLAVMTRLWKEVLGTIESLLVPPLSDKPSAQKPLSQQELDVVFKWLQSLFDFFHAVDEDTGEANGVTTNVLKNPKYHEINTLNFFYFETTENLIRTSERMASATAANAAHNRQRLSAPANLGQSFGGGGLAMKSLAGTRRAKSIMVSRNLGTMRRAKEEKWKAAQAEPSDDMILRILRMRSEASGYLRDRSRQKERLAAAAAAEAIVRMSLMSEKGGRMTGPSVIRR